MAMEIDPFNPDSTTESFIPPPDHDSYDPFDPYSESFIPLPDSPVQSYDPHNPSFVFDARYTARPPKDISRGRAPVKRVDSFIIIQRGRATSSDSMSTCRGEVVHIDIPADLSFINGSLAHKWALTSGGLSPKRLLSRFR